MTYGIVMRCGVPYVCSSSEVDMCGAFNAPIDHY